MHGLSALHDNRSCDIDNTAGYRFVRVFILDEWEETLKPPIHVLVSIS